MLGRYKQTRNKRRARKAALRNNRCQAVRVQGGKCRAIAGSSGYCVMHLRQLIAEQHMNANITDPTQRSRAPTSSQEAPAQARKVLRQAKAPKPVESQSELSALEEEERVRAWENSFPAPRPDGSFAVGRVSFDAEPPEQPPEWPTERGPSPRQILSRHFGEPERLNPEEQVVEFYNYHDNWTYNP